MVSLDSEYGRLEVGDGLAAAAPDEGLAVALRARQPRGGEAAHRQADLGRGASDGEDRLAAVAGVADDAAADPLAPELELRLDHRQDLAPGGQAARHRRQHLDE